MLTISVEIEKNWQRKSFENISEYLKDKTKEERNVL